jgi:hypothetical protein
MLRIIALFGCLLATGCAALPERVHQPTLHNPFPQVSRVGVAPFFNLSAEKTLDGRKAAEAYAAELAEVPGYEVIPVSVVEVAAETNQLDLGREADARRLAQILEIDAVVTGAVTEYSPYYPPRMTLKVAWFAANPNFHPIPAGYGLPWGTAAEKDIPGPLAFQAELALAKEQLKTQTPPYQKTEQTPPPWPDPHGFIPRGPTAGPPQGIPCDEPIMQHTKSYRGNDAEFTTALEDYYYSRDDARIGGWQNCLRRSDEFVRFCCRMHIWEMLGARGGAGETRVVWRWSLVR